MLHNPIEDMLAALALGQQPLGALGQRPSPFGGMDATRAAGQGPMSTAMSQALAGTDGLGGLSQPAPQMSVPNPSQGLMTPKPQVPITPPEPQAAPVSVDGSQTPGPAAGANPLASQLQGLLLNKALEMIFS